MVGQGMIYNVISFSVVLMLIYLVVQRDYYLLMGEGICVFIQWFIKEVTEGWYPPIFKRPDGATNCNIFNMGGVVDTKSGFPSGHVATTTLFIITYMLRNNHMNTNLFMLYHIPIILVAYARIMKGCHNTIQVFAGYLLGYGLAIVLHTYNASITEYMTSVYNKYILSHDTTCQDESKLF